MHMGANVYTCILGSSDSSDRFRAITGWVAFYLVSKGSLAVLVITLMKAIWGLVGNEMAHVPTVTSLSTQRRVGVYTNLNLD
jgi:hypothetical protein